MNIINNLLNRVSTRKFWYSCTTIFSIGLLGRYFSIEYLDVFKEYLNIIYIAGLSVCISAIFELIAELLDNRTVMTMSPGGDSDNSTRGQGQENHISAIQVSSMDRAGGKPSSGGQPSSSGGHRSNPNPDKDPDYIKQEPSDYENKKEKKRLHESYPEEKTGKKLKYEQKQEKLDRDHKKIFTSLDENRDEREIKGKQLEEHLSNKLSDMNLESYKNKAQTLLNENKMLEETASQKVRESEELKKTASEKVRESEIESNPKLVEARFNEDKKERVHITDEWKKKSEILTYYTTLKNVTHENEYEDDSDEYPYRDWDIYSSDSEEEQSIQDETEKKRIREERQQRRSEKKDWGETVGSSYEKACLENLRKVDQNKIIEEAIEAGENPIWVKLLQEEYGERWEEFTNKMENDRLKKFSKDYGIKDEDVDDFELKFRKRVMAHHQNKEPEESSSEEQEEEKSSSEEEEQEK